MEEIESPLKRWKSEIYDGELERRLYESGSNNPEAILKEIRLRNPGATEHISSFERLFPHIVHMNTPPIAIPTHKEMVLMALGYKPIAGLLAYEGQVSIPQQFINQAQEVALVDVSSRDPDSKLKPCSRYILYAKS